MAIPHSTLALLSVTMFTLLLLVATLTSMYSVELTSRAPLLRVYAEALVDPEVGASTIVIKVRHEYGRPVRLLYVDLEELGRISAENFEESYCGVLIEHGELCKFKYTLRGLLNTRRTYSGVAVFSEGVYPVSITPVYIYKPVKSSAPLYDVTFVSLMLRYSNDTGYSLVSNTSYLASEGAQLQQNGTGLVVVDNETYRLFGGLGFVYNNATSLEANFISGDWLIALLRLVNYTNRLPLKWGFGIFFDHRQAGHPQELIAFIGISVNTSSTAYLVVERYDRDRGLVEVVAATLINASLEKLFREILIIAAYVEADRNLNFFRVNATLYDASLTSLASLNGSFTVKLPGTPGAEWYLRPALVVCNVATYYEDFVLADQFVLPLITVTGIPADYILEIYYRETLVFRAVSHGGTLVLPFTWLPSGSVLVVRYPSVLGEVLAYRYVTPVDIGPFTDIMLNATRVRVVTSSSGETATVSVRLPVGDGFTNITGFVALNTTNRNVAPARLRLTLIPEYSVISNLTITIDVFDSSNRSIFSQYIHVSNGTLLSSTTDWSLRVVKPGEPLYLYVVGYYTSTGQPCRVLLKLETLVLNSETMEAIHIEERPILLYFETQ